MFSFFKSNKNKPTTIKSTYYIREGLIHNKKDLNNILILNNEKYDLVKKIKGEIKFKNLSLIDLSQKQLIAEMGIPVYIHDNSDIIKGHKILFYKEDVEFYRFLIQFHFFDDQFLLVSNKVSSSGMITEKEKGKIVNQLIGKYIGLSDENKNHFQLKFTDKNGSELKTIDDVYFYVNYLSGGPIKNTLINRYSDSSNEDSSESNFEDTIDKYF
jgi:hypothetical protein